MSDDKYVPDHEMVRESWIEWCASCGIGRATAYEEFERFIRAVKVEAWGEGATTALVHAGFVVPYDAPIFALNPYGRIE